MFQTIDLWPSVLRKFVFVYLVVSSVGMLTGLAFVRNETGVKPEGIVAHYNGMPAESDDFTEMKFEKSAKDMLLTTHNHVLGLCGLFFISGILFFYTGRLSDGWRLFLMAEPLVALITTFGGLWLVRFVPGFEWFVYVVMISGFSMFLAWGIMTIITFHAIFSGRSGNEPSTIS